MTGPGRRRVSKVSRALCLVVSLIVFLAAGTPAPERTPPRSPREGTAGRQKLALLVGIDRYAAVSALNGCVNDVEEMKALLIGKFDFSPENITVLKDDQATRAGILQAFRAKLIARAGKGDIVVFHYSGHGSRMPDVSGDDIDGWDETIVPQDSRQTGVFDISDDEINGLVRQLSSKTKNITIILDSCHSGSATRGGARIRRIADDTRTPPAPASWARGIRGAGPSSGHFRPADASYVVVTGCGPGELSNEYEAEDQIHGALTYFLVRALGRAGGDTTYRDVMDTVRGEVSAVFPSQHPQLEGSRSDAFVFGDAGAIAQPYFLASPLAAKKVELQAGGVYGLTEGSLFDVYPAGTKSFDPAKAATKIELTRVEPFRSEARIVSGKGVLKFSRAILRKRRYPDAKTRVSFEGLAQSPALQSVKTALEQYPSIEVAAGRVSGQLRLSESGGSVAIRSADLSELSPPVKVSEPDAVAKVVNQVTQWSRWLGVLALSNPTPTLTTRLVLEGAGERGEVREGDEIDVKVKNKSRQDVYVTILDLSSDGSISVISPKQGIEESLPPGKTQVQRVRMFVPEGRSSVTDIVKVLATTVFINPAVFGQPAVRSAEPARSLSSHPLARFLESSVLGASRGAAPVALDGWTTAQASIRVRRSS